MVADVLTTALLPYPWRSEWTHLNRGPRRSTRPVAVVGDADAAKEQANQGLADEARDLGIDERHSRGPDAQCAGGEMKVPIDQSGFELGRAVTTIVEFVEIDSRDHHERGVTREVLLQANPKQLFAQAAATQPLGQ